MDRGAWWAVVHGVTKSRTQLSNFPFTFHFHALEKEMATHSSFCAWRIPGTGEPGGLPSMGSHRVGHDWSDLAAAAAAAFVMLNVLSVWEVFLLLTQGRSLSHKHCPRPSLLASSACTSTDTQRFPPSLWCTPHITAGHATCHPVRASSRRMWLLATDF